MQADGDQETQQQDGSSPAWLNNRLQIALVGVAIQHNLQVQHVTMQCPGARGQRATAISGAADHKELAAPRQNKVAMLLS